MYNLHEFRLKKQELFIVNHLRTEIESQWITPVFTTNAFKWNMERLFSIETIKHQLCLREMLFL